MNGGNAFEGTDFVFEEKRRRDVQGVAAKRGNIYENINEFHDD